MHYETVDVRVVPPNNLFSKKYSLQHATTPNIIESMRYQNQKNYNNAMPVRKNGAMRDKKRVGDLRNL